MKKMLNKGFNPSKCKTSLRMAVSRLKLLRNKKEIQLTQLKREVAKLLETGHDQTARIRVEHVVREEKTIAAYDLLDIYCELVVARLPIIETQKNCPIDLKEAIASIIFASPRCSDIPELMDIRKHLTAKYGKEFATAAVELRPDSGVSRNLIEKLSATAPDGPTKVKILTGIAEENKIKWEPNWFKDNEPEPPAYVRNEPNTDNISKMHVEPQTFQAAPRFEPKHEIPSNIQHAAGSEVNDPTFAYSAARPSGTRTAQGTEPETVESSRSSGGVENSSFGARQKWNMEFKDASAAAHAAAESAEMASMAARAAVELASRGKLTDHASDDSKFVQNEGSRVRVTNTDQGGYADRFSKDNSSRERPSRSEQMQRDPSVNVKASGMMDETNFKKEYNQAVKQDRPNSSQQSDSPKKAVQKDGNRPYTGKRIISEGSSKMEHKQSLERYDEVQDAVEFEEQYDSSPEDSELWRSASSSRVASKYEHETFSYSDRQHDDGSEENIFHEDAVETRKQPSSYQSQSSGRSEDYGTMPSSDPPKFDDDLDEDPFDSTGRGNLHKEDLEAEEPYKDYAFHSTVSQDRKDDVLAFSEQRRYGFESHKHLFSAGDDESRQMEKDSTKTSTNDAAPQFDDYVADEDDFIQSPARKSPVYSSPDEEIFPRKRGASSSKHLYQSEITESFKNTDLFSQLDKPIRLADSDGEISENDDDVEKSKIRERPFARNILYSPKKSETEHREPEEFVGSSYGRRETSSINSEESLEKDSGASISKKSGSGDLSTRQQSSGRTRSRSDAKSYDRTSISRLLEEAERLSSPRRSSLQATPDVIDDSQDNYQSNAESITELNVESLSGGLRNKANRLPPPPFIRGTSTYPSSSISSVDDAPKVREPSTFASSEIRESSSKKESVAKKKPSILQGTYFDPNDDDLTEDAEWKGSISIQNPSDKSQRSSSRVPQSYFESEDISSEEDANKQTLPTKYRSGTVASRRTRASGQNNAAGTRTETRASHRTSSSMESVSENETSSPTSFAADASAKPKTKPVIQMESLEPRRREEIKTRPSHLSKMSSGEEISAPSATSSKDGKSGAETADSPTTSTLNEKTPLRKISDKKASHVHPKLPDSDDFTSHFLSLRKNRQ